MTSIPLFKNLIEIAKDGIERAIPQRRSASSALLSLLISADVAFLILHFLYLSQPFHRFDNVAFSLEKDRGFAELFQYLKEYWIMLLLVWLALRERQLHFAAWSFLFFYLLCDDSAQIHERLGTWVSTKLDLPQVFGLRVNDLGELLVTAALGAALVVPIGLTFLRAPASVRRTAVPLFAVLAGIGFFGVAADMLHQVLKNSPMIYGLAGIIEDWGEMLVMSVGLSYVFSEVMLRRNLISEQRPAYGAGEDLRRAATVSAPAVPAS